MKKLSTLICAGVLMSAFCVFFLACNEPHEPDVIMPDPYANCFVFVTTIPGKETILLAKRGEDDFYDALAMFANYESIYGKGNVTWGVCFPNGINDNGLDYLAANPGAVTNCYEVTMTIDVSAELTEVGDSRLRMDLLNYGFRGVRITDGIAICKKYDWAFTEERAKELIPYYENSFYEFRPYSGISGKIVSSTIKKLGPELHNVPIEF